MNRIFLRWVIVIVSFFIISLILWNTYRFFQKFKDQERVNIDIWVKAQLETYNVPLDKNQHPLVINVIEALKFNQMLLIYENGDIIGNNISNEEIKDEASKAQLIARLESRNEPLEVTYYDHKLNQTVKAGTLYYGNSEVLDKLAYYPLALLLIVFLFGVVVYFFYRSSKIALQNKLWTGMAKETAHQIGTPLSSLVGWLEILKSEKTNPEYIAEIQKDISRLQVITDRFSKIGAIPKLKKEDIVSVTQEAFDYLKARHSKLITFEMTSPEAPVYLNLNQPLYSWTIENLVKNAIDAMKGKGHLKLDLMKSKKYIKINITDTGKGISKYSFSSIFEPGFTTKKRGWGLGLSLAKRIIEDYHHGKIKVLKSELNKGTTMQITLRLL